MRDLVEYIVKQIVNNPDQVQVEESHQDSIVNLALTVAQDDMGIVIGKKGQTIKAIRKLLTVRAMADNVRVNLQLVDIAPRDESPAVVPGAETAEPAKTAEPEDELELKAN